MKLSNHIETGWPFYKKLLAIALPLAAQNMITVGVNLVDNMMLGQLGEVAMSASTQANHFISLFHFCIMGISMGSSVLTARFWGAKDLRSLKQTVTIAMRIGGFCIFQAQSTDPCSLLVCGGCPQRSAAGAIQSGSLFYGRLRGGKKSPPRAGVLQTGRRQIARS